MARESQRHIGEREDGAPVAHATEVNVLAADGHAHGCAAPCGADQLKFQMAAEAIARRKGSEQFARAASGRCATCAAWASYVVGSSSLIRVSTALGGRSLTAAPQGTTGGRTPCRDTARAGSPGRDQRRCHFQTTGNDTAAATVFSSVARMNGVKPTAIARSPPRCMASQPTPQAKMTPCPIVIATRLLTK